MTLEDFFINRFGRELYRTFFRDYTEKVWGVPCREISAEWGAQRIKGLSITKALRARARASLARDAGHVAEGHRDEPDRAFPLPEARPGSAVGGGRAAGRGARAASCHLRHRVVSAAHRGGRIVQRATIADLATGSARTVAVRNVLLHDADEGPRRGVLRRGSGRQCSTLRAASAIATSSRSDCWSTG